jgi:hypothetical protein
MEVDSTRLVFPSHESHHSLSSPFPVVRRLKTAIQEVFLNEISIGSR